MKHLCRLALIAAFCALATVPAFAGGPQQPGSTAWTYPGGFTKTGIISGGLTVGTSSATYALPSPDPTVALQNNGTATIYVDLVLTSTSPTSILTGTPIPAGCTIALNAGAPLQGVPYPFLAVISGSASQNLTVMTGYGTPLQGCSGGGSGGSLPPGAATATNQTNVQAAAGSNATLGNAVQGLNGGLPVSTAQASSVNFGTTASGASPTYAAAWEGCYIQTLAAILNGKSICGPTDFLGAPLFEAVQSADPNTATAWQSTSAASSNLLLKSSGGNLYSAHGTCTASTFYVFVLDRTSAPGTGAITLASDEIVDGPYTANQPWSEGGAPPASYVNGILVAGSSTGPYTFTATSTCQFQGQAK